VIYDVTLNPAASTETSYQSAGAQTVTVTNADNDSAGFTIAPTSLTTSESGAAKTFTIHANTDPGAATIRVDISSGDLTEGTVSPAFLTWTSADYSTDKTVTVTPVNDFAIDGDVAYNVSLNPSASTETHYAALAAQTVSVTNNDDDGTSQSPVISTIPNKTTPKNITLKYVTFTADEGGPNDAAQDAEVLSVVSVTSSNTTLIPNGNITYTFTDSGTSGAGELTIAPAANQTGVSTITLTITDGVIQTQTSFTVTVLNTVNPPTAYNINASTAQNVAVAITLAALPQGGKTIASWTIDVQPLHGTLSGTAPNLTYTPTNGFSGHDQFTYYATDSGGEPSNLAIVTIVVNGSAIFFVANKVTVGNGTGPVGDVAVKNRILALGFTVTLYNDNETVAGAAALSGVDLVIISSSCASGTFTGTNAAAFTAIKNTTKGLMTWEHFLYDSLGMTLTDTAPNADLLTNQTQVTITNANHPLAGGLAAGNQTVFSATNDISWGQVSAAGDVVAQTAVTVGGFFRPVLFSYDAGDLMQGNFTAPGKRVGYFLPDAGLGNLTAAGQTLLDAAINQALSR
jgi:hypothetical protein